MNKTPRDRKAVFQTVEDLLCRADSEGRGFLFEHEVYRVLQEMDIRPPIHHLVAAPADVTPELLSRFPSSRIVLKAVSVGLAHKQRQGGVQVVLKDLEFIRYSLERMSGAFADRGVKLAGVLLVEYVEYDKDLGNEILLGFRESDAFGPVLSFSKGGSDAEHFATHFSPPNIILAPVDRDWAHALLTSTQIHVKYLEEGKEGYIEQIAEAAVRFSDLAVRFSSFFPGSSSYVITEFEINPLAFDPYGRMIPLDGYAAFTRREPAPARIKTAAARGLRPFFQPRGVVVVGVSAADPVSYTHLTLPTN